MNQQSLRLQFASLAMLWVGLFTIKEVQPIVLISMPMLAGLRIWNPKSLDLRRQSRKIVISLVTLSAWLAGTSLGDRGAWLAAFSNLLWLLCGLKVFEVERPGGLRRSALLLLLAAGTSGLFAQSLGASLLQGLAGCLAIASLLALETGEERCEEQLCRLGLLAGLSLPIMVLLFLLAPRLSPVWLLDGVGASTGLSTQLDPGSIASLVRNNEPAMRLQFSSKAPEPAERYWRVLTLNRFDGRRWSANPDEPAVAAPTTTKSSNLRPTISILIEPSNLKWLPWWGSGLPWPNNIRRTADGGLWRKSPVRSRTVYQLAAASLDAPQPWRFVNPTTEDLELPESSNPRLLHLGRQWGKIPAPESRILAARNWFTSQHFRYTLEPGRLPNKNPLDAFLFNKRRGFCEHFAASFSALMRAADIPSRVVIGYQGGEWIQSVGSGQGHLQVQQSDAHAWSEVWIKGRGWIRVDPTAWVVPSRTERNLFESLGNAGSVEDQRLLSQSNSWFNWLRGHWQILDLQWSLWVMQFDQSRQEALLRNWLGSYASRWQTPLLFFILSATMALGLLVLRRLGIPTINRERRQLNRCLQENGLVPIIGEPLEMAVERFSQQRPDLAVGLKNIAKLYNQMRFGDPNQRPSSRLWKACLKDLKNKRYNP